MAINTFSQLPQVENLSFVAGDDFELLLDINLDLTSYVFDAYIEDSTGTQVPFTVTATNLTNGQLSLKILRVVTILMYGSYTWAFKWIDTSLNHLTILAGSVEVINA